MKKLRNVLHNEKATIDLASVMVGVIVLGLIGGVISATIFAIIPWAQDHAAKENLKSVQTAQNVYAGLAADPNNLSSSLVNSGITKLSSDGKAVFASTMEELQGKKLLPTVDPEKLTVATGETRNCYVAMAKSDSGKLFWASNNTEPVEYKPEASSDCVTLKTVADVLTPFDPETCFEFESATGTITNYKNELEECGPDVVIPGTIDGVTVKSLGYTTTNDPGAFQQKELTSVVIPDSVTTIGKTAFYGNNLSSVVIPDSVTIIGSNAFYGNQLTSVAIPDSVTSIGSAAFRNNNLSSVDISERVTTISSFTFSDNVLTSVVIPDSVKTIQHSAFYGNQLTSVVIPDSVTSIGVQAFYWNKLTSVKVGNNVTEIGHQAFYRNQITSVSLGNSVETIENEAFRGNQLTSVVIPDSVTSIENRAFYNNKLASVDLGESVTTIGNEAFYWNELTSVFIPDMVTTIGAKAFANNPSLKTISIPGTTTYATDTFPAGVTPTKR